MRAAVSCPADDVIRAFVDGSLLSAHVDEVKQHILSCEACRRLIAEVAKAQFRSDLLPAGVTIGRYAIRRLLGTGGMGVVYEAHDPTLNRKVALKLIKSRLSDERGDRRLLREAEAMAQLQHPNVVAVYDVGAFADQIFVAMELVDGVTLSAWMKERHDVAAILDVFVQAGRGLVAAHAAGIVHRDFKPDNVLIGTDGRVRVGDFGLARSTPSALDEPSAVALDELTTRGGAVVGTPAYMAPEQFTGDAVDARTDQFCFCVALYEAIYGQRPFAATSFVELKAEVTEGARAAPPQRGIPGRLRAAIMRGLSVAPGDRFASMDELLRQLAPRPPALRRGWMLAVPALVVAVAAVALLRLHAQRLLSSEAEMAPDNAAAAEAYAGGMAALRLDEHERAKDQFARAVELAPTHALCRASLAEAWKALGYDEKAEAEAKRAGTMSEHLSREAKLLVQGRCAVAQGDASEAAKAFAALFAFRPENVEYGLELAQADIDDGRPKDADAVVAKLRRLPAPMSHDLRIATLDAVVNEAVGELDASKTIAADVAAQARARRLKEIEQDALFDEAIALYRLGQLKEALAIAQGLARDDVQSNLPIQRAMLAALLGNIYLAQDRLDDAEKQFREDLRISRALGSRGEITTMLQNLGTIAAARGDHAGQVAALEDTIPLLRERGSQRDLAMALANLCDSMTKVGALQQALGHCEESRDIARAMRDPSSYGYASLQCAKVRLALGELEEAKRRMKEAVASAREVGDKDMLVSMLLSACTLYRTRGEVADAKQALDEARATNESIGHDQTYVTLFAADLELGEGRLAEAEARVQPIVQKGQAPFASVALAFVAEADLERKKYAEAADAVERAQKDTSVATDTDRRIQLLSLAAQAYAALGSPRLGATTAQLEELAKRAKTEGNVEAQLAIRLARAESDRLAQPHKGRGELLALAQEAEHRGFVLIARRARQRAR